MALTAPPDAAVFDFDGVLIDSRQAVRTAVNTTLVEHGFSAQPPETLDRFIGPPVFQAFAELTGESQGSELVAACAESYHRHYEHVYLEQTSLVPGIEPVLAELTLPLALATAKPSPFVAPLLRALRIEDRFRFVFAPAMCALHESKTETVAKALASLEDIGARQVVVVGDRSFDIEAAHANGIAAIGVTWGIGPREELVQARADLIADDPAELPGLLGTPGG